jgi:hypothetical protein
MGLVLSVVVAWVLTLLPLPWSLLAAPAALAAGVFLIRLALASWRNGQRAMAIASAVIGFPAILMIVLGSVLSLVMYEPLSQYQECREEALTGQAQDACVDQFESDMLSWLPGASALGG